MKADLVLGIDSSTTGCKAIVWDSQGRAAAISRSPLSLLTPHPLWYEQPAESWRLAAVKALREISQQVQVERIGALCISHQRETFVPVDKAVKPLRNAILWMDERAGELLPTLRERLDADHFHQIDRKSVV